MCRRDWAVSRFNPLHCLWLTDTCDGIIRYVFIEPVCTITTSTVIGFTDCTQVDCDFVNFIITWNTPLAKAMVCG